MTSEQQPQQRAWVSDMAVRLAGSIDEIATETLKCHLLIEEMLDRIVTKVAFHPEYIVEARLTFNQKISIARSFSLDESTNNMWQIAKSINALRNDFAHSLTSDKRQKRIQHLRSVCEQNLTDQERKVFDGLSDQEFILYSSSLMIGFLSTFEDELTRFRQIIDDMDEFWNPHRHLSVKTGTVGDAGGTQ